MEIRAEKPEDIAAIRQVNLDAFQRENEANLVDALRQVTPTLSFVAWKSDRIVGHIFFSPVSIVGKCPAGISLLGLAPLAVSPEFQKQGIGTLLVQSSLEECRNAGYSAVVVLGNPQYYTRFGFMTAKKRGLQCEYSIPDEYFMVLELQDRALKDCRGVVKYRDEFLQV